MRKHNKTSGREDAEVKQSERRLTIVSIVLSTSYSLSLLYQIFNILWLFNIPYDTDIFSDDFLEYWYFVFFDFFILSSPYLLLFLSTDVRTQVAALCRFKIVSVTKVTPISTSGFAGRK